MNKGKLTYVVLAVIAIFGIAYVHLNYFFSPLSFHQDDVTYLSWNNYTKTVQVEYHLLDDKGWKTKVIADEAEIQKVFTQLKLGLTPVPAYGKLNEHQEGQMVTLIIRRLDDDAVILVVESFFGQGQATLSHNNRRVEITSELNRLIAERLAEAELVLSN